MTLHIDKGIPIPVIKTGRPPFTEKKYPFDAMEVGDSFFVKGRTPSGISASFNAAKRRNTGKQFTARSVDGGVRVWRIK